MASIQRTTGHRRPRLAIALQGSFGHEYYALGLMAAFQKHEVAFQAASGSVAMMLPLWLYFNRERPDIEEYLANHDPPTEPTLIPTWFDMPTWIAYADGIREDFNLLVSHPDKYANHRRCLENLLGLGGMMRFNQAHFDQCGAEYERLMREVTVPVFTNALDAQTFDEAYLYSGPLSGDVIERIGGEKEKQGKRVVVQMDLNRFIASGARAPFIAPIKVHLRAHETHDHQERDVYWMEGALRCNPPLNPLFDLDTTTVLLIRWFAKNKTLGQTHNAAELLDRYFEAVFAAPLEEELSKIEAVARPPRHKPPVTILDPTGDDPKTRVDDFATLVQDELGLFSHFDVILPDQRPKMFERGKEIGEEIYRHVLRPRNW